MPVMERPDADKNTLMFILGALRAARAAMLGVAVFTLVNLAVVLFDGTTTLPMALSAPFYLTVIARFTEGGTPGLMTWGAVGVSLVPVALLGVCWWMSKKHRGWYTAALVLLVADLALLGMTATGIGLPMEVVLPEALFKLIPVVLLVRGITNAKRLAELKQAMKSNQAEATDC